MSVGAAPAAVRGIEISQCVQDLQNAVPLIAGKATLIRVYLDPSAFDRAGLVTGEIAWSAGGGGETYLPALNPTRVDPSRAVTLNDQRWNLDRSLNFRLAPADVRADTFAIRLNRLFSPGGPDIPVAKPAPTAVQFEAAPMLRVRVVGLRYRTLGKDVAPSAIHFSYMKSFLGRTYPVAALEWSQVVVDADFAPPFEQSGAALANAQIAAIRGREVGGGGGVDPRTHYYGLVDDDGGRNFMRGEAFAIPATPQPDVVAAGPAGVPRGMLGDVDASYADWYGAHELAHTFGRRHPGFPASGSGAQGRDDPAFPYPSGQISDLDQRYVGLDLGDVSLGLPMRALPGTTHHDFMTYGERQWPSAYTYCGILDRLRLEDQLSA